MRSSSVMSASFFEKVMKLLIDYFQLTVRRPAQLTRSYLAQILLPLPNPFKPLTIRKPKSSTNRFAVMSHPSNVLMKDQPRARGSIQGALSATDTQIHDYEQASARKYVSRNFPQDQWRDTFPQFQRRQRGSMIPYLHHYNASRML